ncbi:hypothetical protein ACWDUL_33600 [Nocardia niigatensis]
MSAPTMDIRQPRRARIQPGLWLADYLNGYVEAITADGLVIAYADRFSPAFNGASFTGWVVRCDWSRQHSDTITTKRAAVAELKKVAIAARDLAEEMAT